MRLLLPAALVACTPVEAPPGVGPGETRLQGEDQPEADGDTGGQPAADSGADDPDTEVEERDDAAVVSTELPTELPCGGSVAGSVTVENNGSSTWTREGGFKLGAVDDEDPFATSTRAWLEADEVVAPGERHSFTLTFEASAEATDGQRGATDWRMVHEGVRWFGEVAAAELEVRCGEPEPPELDSVVWLHSDISDWPETHTLDAVTLDGEQICLETAGVDEWPAVDFDGTELVGNPWIFIEEDGVWYGATWEWLRPGQTCKARDSVAGTHIKQPPFEEDGGWEPTPGVTYWFMVSGLARFSERNVEERTNLVPLTWE